MFARRLYISYGYRINHDHAKRLDKNVLLLVFERSTCSKSAAKENIVAVFGPTLEGLSLTWYPQTNWLGRIAQDYIFQNRLGEKTFFCFVFAWKRSHMIMTNLHTRWMDGIIRCCCFGFKVFESAHWVDNFVHMVECSMWMSMHIYIVESSLHTQIVRKRNVQ